MDDRVVVVYSGGMDSFTLLNMALKEHRDVRALSFNYGQKHSKELTYAFNFCEKHRIPFHVCDITTIGTLISNSSLMTGGEDIPEGHYEEESMKSTVVPNRNMILLSIAVGHAVSIGANRVYYGAHSGDHAIYPDCRTEFVESISELSKIANYEPVEIHAPFLHSSKGEILRKGIELGLDYSNSWTCYNGREKACGKCGSCTERLEAFKENNISDPLEYEDQL